MYLKTQTYNCQIISSLMISIIAYKQYTIHHYCIHFTKLQINGKKSFRLRFIQYKYSTEIFVQAVFYQNMSTCHRVIYENAAYSQHIHIHELNAISCLTYTMYICTAIHLEFSNQKQRIEKTTTKPTSVQGGVGGHYIICSNW